MKAYNLGLRRTEQNEREGEQDEQLVRLLLSGDFTAYGRLIRKHRVLVNGLAFALTKDRDNARGLVMVAMMTLWTERSAVKESIPFPCYLQQLVIRLHKRGFPYLSDI